MKKKVKDILDILVPLCQSWPGVEAIALQHYVEKDVLDLGFSITLDIFYQGEMPPAEERREAYTGSSYFETSRGRPKDRFLMNELPVSISFKEVVWVDEVMTAAALGTWLVKEHGTYLFHRLAAGNLLFDRSGWIQGILKKIDQLPDLFWTCWIDSCQMRLDHYLSDIGSAVVSDDLLYFRLSLAGFAKTLVQTLFALNRVFEPGPRDLSAALALLEEKPSGFDANWESILRDDAELSPDRKHEVALLLARGVFSLSSY